MVSGRPCPIRHGCVTNVPAGIGAKRTTTRMLVENKEIVAEIASTARPHASSAVRPLMNRYIVDRYVHSDSRRATARAWMD